MGSFGAIFGEFDAALAAAGGVDDDAGFDVDGRAFAANPSDRMRKTITGVHARIDNTKNRSKTDFVVGSEIGEQRIEFVDERGAVGRLWRRCSGGGGRRRSVAIYIG